MRPIRSQSLSLLSFVLVLAAAGCAESAKPAKAAETPSKATASKHDRHETPEAHQVNASPDARQAPTTHDTAIERLREARSRVPENTHVERIVLTDIAYPNSKEEFDELGGWALVLLSGFAHNAAELPFKRAFVRLGDQTVELQMLLKRSTQVEPQDADVAETFGKNRFDALYIVPVGITQVSVELLVDFAAARTDFVAQQFPMPNSTLGLPEGIDLDHPPGKPSVKALQTFVMRVSVYGAGEQSG